jgi:hypothetical protein
MPVVDESRLLDHTPRPQRAAYPMQAMGKAALLEPEVGIWLRHRKFQRLRDTGQLLPEGST